MDGDHCFNDWRAEKGLDPLDPRDRAALSQNGGAARLDGTPLYEGCGEESSLPESAAAMLRALATENADLRERLEAAEAARDAAVQALSDAEIARGRAEGKLAASEMAGIVNAWRDRAERAEAALTEARAREAAAETRGWNAAIEAAAQAVKDAARPFARACVLRRLSGGGYNVSFRARQRMCIRLSHTIRDLRREKEG